MNRDRFETLAETYGGDVARWPADVREAAAALMAEHPSFARETLARAASLDDLLDAFRSPRASAALTERIVACAPRARTRWRRWLAPAGLGAGLAAACAAGLIVGVQLSEPASDADALLTAVSEDYSLYLEDDA